MSIIPKKEYQETVSQLLITVQTKYLENSGLLQDEITYKLYLAKKQLKKMQFEHKRELLKRLLTVLSFDLSGELNKQMDNILQYELSQRSIVTAESLQTTEKVAIWQGDITRLKVDAIVNAANCKLLGCFVPNHPCIDNCIHSWAGPRLRQECREIMKKQNFQDEPSGLAKITKGYNLPSKYVIHTVGPIANSKEEEDPERLRKCYQSILQCAKENNIKTLAFCGISTGLFGYSIKTGATVAIETVKQWLSEDPFWDLIIFNCFKDEELLIYKKLFEKKF
ncbi:poly [adp-ribose] polymerase [Anaeramoeba flamelloides]|uniref:Poly [adp-ribose] polymerase n=1 Tax=Anaeramoeba flamelloides TaxID=1746091 RepID=A0ABQ8X0Z4_9EUKA|nr:poly [adp-ribose] polymerase [Anaeramoeba flamelloides]